MQHDAALSSATAISVQHLPSSSCNTLQTWLNGGVQGNCVIPRRAKEKLRHNNLI